MKYLKKKKELRACVLASDVYVIENGYMLSRVKEKENIFNNKKKIEKYLVFQKVFFIFLLATFKKKNL